MISEDHERSCTAVVNKKPLKYAARTRKRGTVDNVVLRVEWLQIVVKWTGDTGRDGPLRV